MLQILCLSLMILTLLTGGAQGAKSYSAERFDVDIAIQEDGALIVTETVVFRFTGGPFTRVFRELAPEKVDGITVLQAGMDGQEWPRGEETGAVEISGRTPEVEWHLPPTSDETHTFTLTYRVEGVVRTAAQADVLIWQALPEERDYSIDASTVVVTYPDSTVLVGQPTVQNGTATVEAGEDRVVFAAQAPGPDALLIVRLEFAPGTVIATPPRWQARQERAGELLPLFVGLGTGLFAVGGAGALLYALRYRRSVPEPAGDLPAYTLPGDLPPAVVAALMASGAKGDWNGAVATLFSLAQRGVLSILETPDKRWYQSRQFEVMLQDWPAGLRPHEESLLTILFETKKGIETSVKLSDLGGRFGRQSKQFAERLKQEMVEAGLLDSNRQQSRDRLMAAGVIALLVGGVGIIVGAIVGGLSGLWPALAVPAGLLLAGLVALVASALISPLSILGLQEQRRWKSFAGYLRDVARDKQFAGPDVFDPYLPYAAALGVAEAWVKHFQKQEQVPIPAWFEAVSDGSAAWVALVAATSATSGAGAGAVGGAAGGAAGGGASGAS